MSPSGYGGGGDYIYIININVTVSNGVYIMSNTITIKDPNGNIVCSVENVNAIKSEEGFIDNWYCL